MSVVCSNIDLARLAHRLLAHGPLDGRRPIVALHRHLPRNTLARLQSREHRLRCPPTACRRDPTMESVERDDPWFPSRHQALGMVSSREGHSQSVLFLYWHADPLRTRCCSNPTMDLGMCVFIRRSFRTREPTYRHHHPAVRIHSVQLSRRLRASVVVGSFWSQLLSMATG